MESSDISLTVRRARRTGGKKLDLSQRGLTSWPEEIFALKSLTVLNVSGNALASIDDRLSQFENLEDLDLSNNQIADLTTLASAVAGLQQLQTVMLEGNPVCSTLTPSMLAQLARPPITVGKMPAQVIRGILAEVSQTAPGAPSPPPPPPPPLVERAAAGTAVEACRAKDACSDDDAPKAISAPVRTQAPAAAQPQAPFKLPGADEAAAWKRERKKLVQQIEDLQTKVKELEEDLEESRPKAKASTAAAASSAPSWLQEGKASMAATLPSRRGEVTASDEASELKQQLKDEQRKSKRLEREVQKLSERAQERETHTAGTGGAPHFEWTDEGLELGEQISQGGFSVVHKGYWHGTEVAIKKLFDPKITQELLDEFDNEVQKLEQIRHPNILMLLALHRKPPALAFITEMVAGGSMYELIHKPEKFNCADGPITEATLKQSLDIYEITGGAIAFLHARGIAHRDIKTQNVLLSPKMEVKLCDFGLARMRSELMTGTMQFAGTPNYMAPEIFRNQKYTENVDVFAFGTMLWEAAAMDIPWANFDGADIRDRVLAGKMQDIPKGLPYELNKLIQECWTGDRAARPPMATVLRQLRTCPRERVLTSRPPPTKGGTIQPTAFATAATRATTAAPPGTAFGN